MEKTHTIYYTLANELKTRFFTTWLSHTLHSNRWKGGREKRWEKGRKVGKKEGRNKKERKELRKKCD